jgi:hypothetical protein
MLRWQAAPSQADYASNFDHCLSMLTVDADGGPPMSRYPLRAWLLSSLPLLGLTLATADEMHHHGSHVHGEVILNLALEGVTLIAEIEATGAQVLGFEQAPRNPPWRPPRSGSAVVAR